MNFRDVNKVLIIGMAGSLAKNLANFLISKKPEMKIIGVDSRETSFYESKSQIDVRKMSYSRGNFERLFRENQFDVVFHLARVNHAHLVASLNMNKRLNLNLIGTKRILDLCKKSKVKKVVILSTYHVYGALHDNPTYMDEDQVLRASIEHPELRDVVGMDQLVTNWMWKNQNEIETLVLRPSAIIGPNINNTITLYLKNSYVPVCADFNPMFQFLHQKDLIKVCVEGLEKLPTGVYNVAPSDVISLKTAKEILNQPTIPIPSFILRASAKLTRALVWSFPLYLIDYIQYSCVIDNKLLLKYLGEEFFSYNCKDALIEMVEEK